jgi:hypothetical protein
MVGDAAEGANRTQNLAIGDEWSSQVAEETEVCQPIDSSG